MFIIHQAMIVVKIGYIYRLFDEKLTFKKKLRTFAPCYSTHRLSEELGKSKDTIPRQIKILGKSYRSCRSVSHKLTLQQSQRRLDIYCQLIRIPWMIDLSAELSNAMKNGSITATLTTRNSCSVLINLPKSSLRKSRFGPK